MGTSLTPNLSLIKPDEKETIKNNWFNQYNGNLDKIDTALLKSEVQEGGSYSPVWAATGTNPTLGTGGFVRGKYKRIGPHIIFTWIMGYTGSSGFVGGSGSYSLSTPISLFDGIVTPIPAVVFGKAFLRDSSSTTASGTGIVDYATITTVSVRPDANGSLAWTPTAPFTFSDNDRFSLFFIMYTEV